VTRPCLAGDETVGLHSYHRVEMDFLGAASLALASGLISGVVVALVSHYLQGRRRAADVRESRRRDAAQIVGPALASLRDLESEPNISALRGHPRAAEALAEKWAAWLAASGGLEVLGATHPTSAVDAGCQSVIDNGTKLLTGVDIAVRHGDVLAEGEWNRLKGLHQDALTDARQLVQDVLEEPA
jgi:hypothetical protein